LLNKAGGLAPSYERASGQETTAEVIERFAPFFVAPRFLLLPLRNNPSLRKDHRIGKFHLSHRLTRGLADIDRDLAEREVQLSVVGAAPVF